MRLREARKAKGWSQQRLADELGVSQPLVCKWESGDEAVPATQKAQIAKTLGQSVDLSAGQPLTANEQKAMFWAIQVAAEKIGYEWSLKLFAKADADEVRKLTDLILRNHDDRLLLPPGVG